MKEKIHEIINLVLKNREKKALKELDFKLKLKEDIGFDSLDLAELTVRIEAEYGVDIFENNVVTTVGEIFSSLEK